MAAVTVVRIYTHEAEEYLKSIMHYLHEEAKVKGVTVFRGISGFGPSGKVHEISLVDLSLDLPLVIEFFDISERVVELLPQLTRFVALDHIISWTAQLQHGLADSEIS